MKIKVYEDRYLVENKNISASQYENLATTLEFEFPEFIKKDGIEISTQQLNKYIVFDIEEEENQDIIVDNKYSIPYEIAKLSEVTFIIKITESSEDIDVSDKLIWNSQKFTIHFNETLEGHTNITSEKLDAFNTVVTTLNQKVGEVDTTIRTVETKVENGEFNGKDGTDGENGLTPYISNGYWYIGEENTGVRAEAKSIKNIQKLDTLNDIDKYMIIFTDDTYFVYEIKNGIDGKDYIITSEDKREITDNIKTDIQPMLDEITDTANEAVSIAKGANQSLVYNNYSEMITIFNTLENNMYKIGQNVLIVTLNVPDLWISEIMEEPITYTYTDDDEFTNALKENGYIQIGYYKLSALETQKVDLIPVNQSISDLENNKAEKTDVIQNTNDIASILTTLGGLDCETGNWTPRLSCLTPSEAPTATYPGASGWYIKIPLKNSGLYLIYLAFDISAVITKVSTSGNNWASISGMPYVPYNNAANLYFCKFYGGVDNSHPLPVAQILRKDSMISIRNTATGSRGGSPDKWVVNNQTVIQGSGFYITDGTINEQI